MSTPTLSQEVGHSKRLSRAFVTSVLISVGMLFCAGLSLMPNEAAAQSGERKQVRLGNESFDAVIDLSGGALVSLRLQGLPINPLSWNTPPAGNLKPWAFGHFLCLDRWGPPSEAEGANGMPYHGEATHVEWVAQSATGRSPKLTEAVLVAELPLAGIGVQRRIQVSIHQPILKVSEEVRNHNKLGRILNMVQHPTIAPPFLQPGTLIDCNGRRGIAQGDRPPALDHPSTTWPKALQTDGKETDISRAEGEGNPSVSTYFIEEPIGWITAATPSTGLLIGYFWRTSDYPWVSHWRDFDKGKPTARGLEFGTTGLHHPFTALTKIPLFWGQPTYLYLDANGTTTREYWAFLMKIPSDFQGTGSIRIETNALRLTEKGGSTPRDFSISLDSGLQPRL